MWRLVSFILCTDSPHSRSREHPSSSSKNTRVKAPFHAHVPRHAGVTRRDQQHRGRGGWKGEGQADSREASPKLYIPFRHLTN